MPQVTKSSKVVSSVAVQPPPKTLIDTPSPFASETELRGFLSELESLPEGPEKAQAKQAAQGYLRDRLTENQSSSDSSSGAPSDAEG